MPPSQPTEATAAASPLDRRILAASVVITALGLAASAAGVWLDFPYARETPSWAAQGRGQDAFNLVLFPVLAAVGLGAARGSLRAYLAWLGLLIYSAYSYLLYAGYVHYGPLFLVYVATFSASAFALGWGVLRLDAARMSQALAGGRPAPAGSFLIAVAGLFLALDLAINLTALAGGTVPQAIVETGLPVDPVHLLDMGLMLPASLAAGVSLLRGGRFGAAAVVPLLVFLGAMALAVGTMFVAMSLAGLPVAWPMVGVFAAAAAISLALAAGLARQLRGRSVRDVLRAA
jgi:hypothetical protein